MRERICLCTVALAAAVFAGPAVDTSADRMKSPLKVDMTPLGTLKPRSTREIKSSNWTIDGCPVDRDFVDFDKYCDYLPALGIKKIRILTGWAKCERVKGQIDVAWLDHIVDWCKAHGIETILEFSYGNPIYEGGGGAGLSHGIPNGEAGLAAWDRWVEFVANHFGGRVREYAMWNEPDNKGKHTAEQIAAFNVRTAKVLRKIVPGARIHALSLASNSPKLLENCLVAMGEDVKLFDTFIYHGYAINPDTSYVRVEEQKALVKKYAPHARLRQGENGCSSEFIDMFALSKVPWSEQSQAKWDMRRMLGDLGHGVESSVFGIVDINYAPPTFSCHFANRKGLLRINASNDVIRVKRAYYAVQNVVSVFDDQVGLVPKKRRQASTTDRSLSFYEYKARGGEPLLAFWHHGPTLYDKATKTYSLNNDGRPGDSFETRPFIVEWSGRPFRDPVWVDLYTGRVYAFPNDLQVSHSCGVTFFDVPVYDSPCLLTERTALDLQ